MAAASGEGSVRFGQVTLIQQCQGMNGDTVLEYQRQFSLKSSIEPCPLRSD